MTADGAPVKNYRGPTLKVKCFLGQPCIIKTIWRLIAEYCSINTGQAC